MAEFGRRKPQSAYPAQARRRPADLATAVAVVKAGNLPHWARVGPLRIVLVLLATAGGFWLLILPYAGDLLRDHRLAGTWQPAYDMKVTEGRCTRYQLPVTICEAKIKSLPEPDRSPLTIRSMMAFSSGGGEALLPMRSMVDPSAITIAYVAETKLLNRTLTFIVLAGGSAAVFLSAVTALLRGRYVGGTAHRDLLAGLAGR